MVYFNISQWDHVAALIEAINKTNAVDRRNEYFLRDIWLQYNFQRNCTMCYLVGRFLQFSALELKISDRTAAFNPFSIFNSQIFEKKIYIHIKFCIII